MKNENTDTINRAIHKSLGLGCWHIWEGQEAAPWYYYCVHCGIVADEQVWPPEYTIPGQPLEDAKAWAKNKFKADIFGKAVLDFVCVRRDDVPFSSDYDWVADFVTLPAIDMANIIFGLINEAEGK